MKRFVPLGALGAAALTFTLLPLGAEEKVEISPEAQEYLQNAPGSPDVPSATARSTT